MVLPDSLMLPSTAIPQMVPILPAITTAAAPPIIVVAAAVTAFSTVFSVILLLLVVLKEWEGLNHLEAVVLPVPVEFAQWAEVEVLGLITRHRHR